jgi:hypothetical protein
MSHKSGAAFFVSGIAVNGSAIFAAVTICGNGGPAYRVLTAHSSPVISFDCRFTPCWVDTKGRNRPSGAH